MTGKTLRATLMTGSITLMGIGIGMLGTPTGQDHTNHVIGATFMLISAMMIFVREQVKEEQALAAVNTIEKIGIIL